MLEEYESTASLQVTTSPHADRTRCKSSTFRSLSAKPEPGQARWKRTEQFYINVHGSTRKGGSSCNDFQVTSALTCLQFVGSVFVPR